MGSFVGPVNIKQRAAGIAKIPGRGLYQMVFLDTSHRVFPVPSLPVLLAVDVA